MADSNEIVTIFLGFVVFMLVLMEMHGFSAAGAIFAIPAVILSGLLLFISHLSALVLGAFFGALMGAGVIGLLFLAVALIWARHSVAAYSAQNFMLFAVLLIMMLLVI